MGSVQISQWPEITSYRKTESGIYVESPVIKTGSARITDSDARTQWCRAVCLADGRVIYIDLKERRIRGPFYEGCRMDRLGDIGCNPDERRNAAYALKRHPDMRNRTVAFLRKEKGYDTRLVHLRSGCLLDSKPLGPKKPVCLDYNTSIRARKY